jgi:hypothetical protein
MDWASKWEIALVAFLVIMIFLKHMKMPPFLFSRSAKVNIRR